jgi:hypothetical protein
MIPTLKKGLTAIVHEGYIYFVNHNGEILWNNRVKHVPEDKKFPFHMYDITIPALNRIEQEIYSGS